MTTLKNIKAEILFKNRYQFSDYGIDIYLKIDDVLAVLDKYAEQEPTIPCDLCGFNTSEFCEYLSACPATGKAVSE